jgi:hypothetical protein
MMRRNVMLVIAFGLATLGSSLAWSQDADQAALIKALGDAKLTLLQGIAVTTATWTPKKEVFADLKHIARSAQYHALLSMTKVSIPTIIQKASAQGTVLSVKEKIRGRKSVFEVMVVQNSTIRPTFYDLATGEPTAS